jgi:hypothetical protein
MSFCNACAIEDVSTHPCPQSKFDNNGTSTRKSSRPVYEATWNVNPFSTVGLPALITRSIRISRSSDEFLRSLRPWLDGALERFWMANQINEYLKFL